MIPGLHCESLGGIKVNAYMRSKSAQAVQQNGNLVTRARQARSDLKVV
jgi:hypothetical protein